MVRSVFVIQSMSPNHHLDILRAEAEKQHVKDVVLQRPSDNSVTADWIQSLATSQRHD